MEYLPPGYRLVHSSASFFMLTRMISRVAVLGNSSICQPFVVQKIMDMSMSKAGKCPGKKMQIFKHSDQISPVNCTHLRCHFPHVLQECSGFEYSRFFFSNDDCGAAANMVFRHRPAFECHRMDRFIGFQLMPRLSETRFRPGS